MMGAPEACATCGAPVLAVPLPQETTRDAMDAWARAKAAGHSPECLRLHLKAVADAFLGINWARLVSQLEQ
jgi:hypothetical protein